MPITTFDLAKKLDIAPEAVTLHAMDLDFEIPEDDMIPDEIASEIEKIELGSDLAQTEHEIEAELDREIIEAQQKRTAGSQKKVEKKKDKKVEPIVEEVLIVKTDDGTIILPEELTVRELAIKIGKPIPIVLVKLKANGIIANLKENIDYETAAILAEELGIKVKKETSELSGEDLFRGNLKDLLADEETEHLQKRPPVISVMGHVDHGKTSILDFIRKEKVADDEAGGITQRIGAYQITVGKDKMTFLDTPGHEAFTAMRARGARATDIAILVVAATEGLKPQSVEAIAHAREAGIPVIVAINKMDLDGANPDLVKGQLAENELTPEDWSGDTPCVPVSAKTGEGIEKLLDTIKIVAELQELKANPNRSAIATVIESSLDQKSGVSATVLVNTGTLRKSDSFVIYDQNGRIRSMKNHAGEFLTEAKPSVPVQISGISKLPRVGDLLQVVKSDKIARKKAEEVAGISHEDKLSQGKKASLAMLKSRIAEGKLHQLKVIVKADQDGTREAILSEIAKCRTDESFAKVVHSGVGEVTESDVLLASAGDTVLIAFDVAVPGRIKKLAEKEGVEILEFSVIYHLTEKINDILLGVMEEQETEEILGSFVIKAVFASNKKMAVLGGNVTAGKIQAKLPFRLFREADVEVEAPNPPEGEERAKNTITKEEQLISEGKVDSVQIGQKVEHEIGEGSECGMKVKHKELQFEPGDRIEIYRVKKK
ncbi:MAG: translation initiation factor IF-2 [Candidatus Peregrinibacteria bacterium]|nr:translation initiation factor IF-2 [Candidatus Peregrinibacteria bacterium]